MEMAEALEMLEIVEERMGLDTVVGMEETVETEDMVDMVTNWKIMMKTTIINKKLFDNYIFFLKRINYFSLFQNMFSKWVLE